MRRLFYVRTSGKRKKKQKRKRGVPPGNNQQTCTSQLPSLPRYRLGDPVDSSRALPSPNRRVLRRLRRITGLPTASPATLRDRTPMPIVSPRAFHAGKPRVGIVVPCPREQLSSTHGLARRLHSLPILLLISNCPRSDRRVPDSSSQS